jgi:hypothetical protein
VSQRVSQRAGRHRPARAGWPFTGRIGLVVALAMAVVYVSLPAPKRAATAAPAAVTAAGPVALAKAWPRAHPSTVDGQLADATAYAPQLYLDATTSVGTAPTPDGTAVRVLLRAGGDQPRELRRVPANLNPQFTGFVADATSVVWAESTADAKGAGATRIFRADRHAGSPAVQLTADTGDIVFFNSQYDIVLAAGSAHWVSAARTDDPQTELRSVPLTGGTVVVQRFQGAYGLSTWPWLASAASGQGGPVDLFNPQSGARVRVPAQSTELVGCTPTWCRALVLAANGGPARIDLMRPDGSGRQREAGSTATAAVQDVALLDRFEVLSQGESSGPSAKQQLLLFDLKSRRTVAVADDVGVVQARDGVLFWSTGEGKSVTWHALDLRTLS